MEDAIFRPNDGKEDSLSDYHANIGDPIDRDVRVYTLFGDHDELEENGWPLLLDDKDTDAEDRPKAYARVVVINGGQRHFSIRRDSSGRFFDPLGLYSENQHNKLRHRTNTRQWEWVAVNEKAFNSYVQYLKTRNKARLTIAEREMF